MANTVETRSRAGEEAGATAGVQGPGPRFSEVRGLTEALAAPLSPEDQTVQSMPDVSPTKWHRAHTTWFFETFLLEPHLEGYRTFHPSYRYLFNSYYEAVGPRHPRVERGVVSRPGIGEVAAYRAAVDRSMLELLSRPLPDHVAGLVELGLHHEQQHQELLLMDIKHVLSCNPLAPAYRERRARLAPRPAPAPPGWVEHDGGLVEVGHDGSGFAFDNEGPRHVVHLEPFALADRLVTNGDWQAFVDDGGYRRPELWLSDGWATVTAQRWESPLYWRGDGGRWSQFTLAGLQPLDPAEPVCHVSYYEADAYARWAGARLATEAEWEAVAGVGPVGPLPFELGALHPQAATAPAGGGPAQLFGEVWQWTVSAYSPYPGFRPAPGAVGEYNGKFMVNQLVLRGGCRLTPPGHLRPTYRNFFPPSARWACSGVRLARDADARPADHRR